MAINRSLPTFNADGTAVVTPSRVGSRLEAYTLPLGGNKQSYYGDEGSYFTAYNVTDGTGIAGHPAPVQADLSTKPLLHIFNGNPASSGKSIILDFIRIRVTAVGASGTTMDFTIWIDQKGSTSKSGGTGTVATPVNCRSDQYQATGAVVTFGVVTGAVDATERMVDHQRIRSVRPIVEDQYLFQFGASEYTLPSDQLITTAIIASIYCPFAPVVIQPGGNFKLVQWRASQSATADSYEYTVGWTER